ncbi:unnamed protein product [Bursaphelenchus xylophilus]|uniref:(pine wood nematode) hypothetical protein n=1 Tax=Bursaphelenchus xylophilus TaxID=6326 RepID=A0A1I7SRN7_BURXY|nr:unnamed protein product [Bursaphelenchus xylophilus]CAG9102067.1 unnamed protein product [Bursaphelenchus xylophilus]
MQNQAAPHANEPRTNFAALLEKDRRTLSKIRTVVLKLNEYVEKNCVGENLTVDEVKSRFKKLSDTIERDYESIEQNAMKLMALTQDNHNHSQQMNRLNNFLMESLCDTGTKGIYEKAQQLTSTSESTFFEYLNYAYEFMKTTAPPSKPRRLDDGNRLHAVNWRNQQLFEEGFDIFKKFNKRILINWLEKSKFGGILEVRLMNGDKGIVCMMKWLFVVYNGQFEYVHIIAPFEDYTYQDDNRKRVDLSVESKYEIYRRLTHQANVVLPQYASFTADHRNYISHIMQQYFFKMTSFDEVCFQCKKHLKDFQPPIIDPRTAKKPFHESCR